MSERRFHIVWLEGYCQKAPETVGTEFFSRDNGFLPEDTAAILDLELGCVHSISDPGGELTIERTQ